MNPPKPPIPEGQAAPDRPREFYCTVHGEVQNVFFRKFAQDKAREFGVTGYVKNTEDGSVEIIAQGREDALKKFAELLYSGPEDAAVDSAEIQWGPVTEPYTQFDIL
jgi:acylphosphatase